MPTALWTAVTLRLGTVDHSPGISPWLYVATVLSTVPVFVRSGLYRAVIRFLGIQAAATIALGVAFSAAVIASLDHFALGGQLPPEAIAIYFVLALLYVGATRFGARELLRLGGTRASESSSTVPARRAAQLCARWSTTFAVPSHRTDRRQRGDAWSATAWIQGGRTRQLRELRRRHGVELVLLAMPSAHAAPP